MDWDTFYEEWSETHEYEDMPTNNDYVEWMYDKADLAFGE